MVTKLMRGGGRWVKEGRTGRRIFRLPPGTSQYFIVFKRGALKS